MSEAQVKATPKWAVHPHELHRIVLADYIETTVCRTHCGMFSEAANAEHANLIVRAVNSHDKLLGALKAAHKLLTAEHFDTSDGLVSRCEEIAKLAEAAIQSAEESPK